MARRTPTERKTHKSELERRQRQAFKLHLGGLSHAEIGAQLEVSRETIRRDVKAAFDELAEESKTELSEMRNVANARLALMRRSIAGAVLAGDLGAISRFLKIEERHARLNGLDAPISIHQKIEGVVEVEEQFDFSRLTQPELDLYIQLQEKIFVRPTGETGAV